jgi:glycine/D-amino acid oxidase-like deaminating enzyme
VEPRSVAAALAAAARDRGVTIRTRVEVTAIEARDGAVRGVVTPEGQVETSWVVVAAGAWGRSLTRTLGVNLRSVPVRHQAFVTVPLEGVLPGQAIVRFTEPQVYCRPEGSGLLVGGYGYRPLSFEMDGFPPGFEIPALEADPVYYRQLTDAAAALVPCLRDAAVVQERRGLPTMSPDGRILVGEPNGVKGLIVASACLVGGIERCPGMGRLVAEIVTGRPTFVPLDALHLDRFGDAYANDAALRAACEELYSHHYHEVY